MRVCVDFEWSMPQTVSLDATGRLVLPLMRPEPGIYRFRLTTAVGLATHYYGEAEDLKRRLYHYSRPGPSQMTNIRMNERMRRTIIDGGRVDVAMAKAAKLEVGGRPVALDLSRRPQRLILENTALLLAAESGVAVDNL